MAPKLYKATEVCEMAQLQSYVLRSWEKEFPGIGVQKTADGARLYRQSDVDQVLRIKQLVFGEGLTLAGARRRLEESAPPPPAEDEVAEVLGALASDARTRIASVRQGLKSILAMLSTAPGPVVIVEDALVDHAVAGTEYHLEPPALAPVGAKPRPLTLRRKESAAHAPVRREKAAVAAKRGKHANA